MSIQSLIDAHRAAVLADEANFTDAGVAIDLAAADASGDREIAAYRALVAAPCTNAEEAKAKVAYFINGSVGMRTSLIECLTEPCYEPDTGEGNLTCFLRSLQVEG